jgi:hypothetical protein
VYWRENSAGNVARETSDRVSSIANSTIACVGARDLLAGIGDEHRRSSEQRNVIACEDCRVGGPRRLDRSHVWSYGVDQQECSDLELERATARLEVACGGVGEARYRAHRLRYVGISSIHLCFGIESVKFDNWNVSLFCPNVTATTTFVEE